MVHSVVDRYGDNELVCTGSLRDWTSIPILPSITVPTLLINGSEDEAQDVVFQVTEVAPEARVPSGMVSSETRVLQRLNWESVVQDSYGKVQAGRTNEVSLDNRVLYDTDPAVTVG